jgi:hypothetical protein
MHPVAAVLEEQARFLATRGIGGRSGASLVLERGRAFTRRPLPKGVRRGKEGNCFYNGSYVEGYAMEGSGILVHHAWNTPDGVT